MLTLVLGGIASGKSAFAQRLAAAATSVVVVATGTPSDVEMAARIDRHQRSRPPSWGLVEEPMEPLAAVRPGSDCILFESVDSWLANLMADQAHILGLPESCLDGLTALAASRRVILVSSEVGQSLVPIHPVGRAFTDMLGHLNQLLAAAADQVFYVVAGLPIPLKPTDAPR